MDAANVSRHASRCAANATDEDVARAAHQLGCTDDEIRALFDPVGNDQGVLALGRALARDGGR